MLCVYIVDIECVTPKSPFWEPFIGFQLRFRGWYLRSQPLEYSGAYTSGRFGSWPRVQVFSVDGVCQDEAGVCPECCYVWGLLGKHRCAIMREYFLYSQTVIVEIFWSDKMFWVYGHLSHVATPGLESLVFQALELYLGQFTIQTIIYHLQTFEAD